MPATHQIIRLKRMVGAGGKKSHTLQSQGQEIAIHSGAESREGEVGKKKLRMMVGATAAEASPASALHQPALL